MPNYTSATLGSSCTPPHGPLKREARAGPPGYSARVPKGQRRDPSPISKIKQKGKGVARSAACRPLVCFGRRRALSRTLGPLCAPHLQIWTPAMTRPVAARIAHTGRTASFCGPHRLEVGFGVCPSSKTENKEKGAAGSKFRPAPGGRFGARGYPLCSLGNESVQGEWPAAALAILAANGLGQNGSAPA